MRGRPGASCTEFPWLQTPGRMSTQAVLWAFGRALEAIVLEGRRMGCVSPKKTGRDSLWRVDDVNGVCCYDSAGFGLAQALLKTRPEAHDERILTLPLQSQ